MPPWPGVVVCMEGYGMDQWLLRVCQRLAAEGYAAIAPDRMAAILALRARAG